MSHESLPSFLAKVDLFAGLSKETLSDLIARGSTLAINPGAHATEQGSDDAGLQVVLDGSAEVSVNGVDREPLGPGDYFGEISLIDGLPRSATVVAGPDGLTTFALSSLAFAPVVKENPEAAYTLLKALAARVRLLESQG
ncbi:MAG: family transcriptional regulator, cyclic receptor protein [Kribbellaceae bacterium]|jgi:CRP-like cAMP-binding protein|nr:family transcriptional regulator, cyclic receptor protein [Kribbellaceae bacterium]